MSGSLTRSSSNLSAVEAAIFCALVGLFFSGLSLAAGGSGLQVKTPCAETEEWNFGEELHRTVPEDLRREFSLFLVHEVTPAQSYADAWALKKIRPYGATGLFADYWTARTFFELGLYGLAANGFNSLLTDPPTPTTAPIQVAAIACLEKIHKQIPPFSLSEKAMANLPAFFPAGITSRKDMATLWEAAAFLVLDLIEKGAPRAKVDDALSLLHGSGTLESFVTGLAAFQSGHWDEVVARFTPLVEAKLLPPDLERRRNELRLLLASAHFETGKYADSIKQLELVDKKSPALAPALARLSSALLMTGEQAKAVGTSVRLQGDGMSREFAPEGMMVAAIVLDEHCQYRQSLHWLESLRKSYGGAFEWLEIHVKQADQSDGKKEALYYEAVNYLKGAKPPVPDRVAREWTRSGRFQAGKLAIESLTKEIDDIQLLLKRTEQALPARAKDEGERRLLEAWPRWKEALKEYQKEGARRRDAIIESSDAALTAMDSRMYRQLLSVLENIDLIEAEAWDGLGHDDISRMSRGDGREPAFDGAPSLVKVSLEDRCGGPAKGRN